MSRANRKADLGVVFDKHARLESEECDLDATMRTMAANPYVWNVPTAIGGKTHRGVYGFYKTQLIGKMPLDTKVTQVSRTVGGDQVVHELILSFTHDTEIKFMLPGVKPTGRGVELPHVVVMKFDRGKVAYEHIYWDQASLLAQGGLLDPKLLPVTGRDQAKKLLTISHGAKKIRKRGKPR